MTSSANTQ